MLSAKKKLSKFMLLRFWKRFKRIKMRFSIKPVVLAVAMAASSVAAASSFQLIPGTENQYALGLNDEASNQSSGEFIVNHDYAYLAGGQVFGFTGEQHADNNSVNLIADGDYWVREAYGGLVQTDTVANLFKHAQS